ncbi:hypothetical protein BDW69DRAFT_163231 [Aspergillus filifer]
MASGLITDPLRLVRVAPLITTTASLMFAWDEHWFLSGFLSHKFNAEADPDYQEHSEALLPRYFRRFFEQGIFIIAGLNCCTLTSSIANLVLSRRASTSQSAVTTRLYAAGLGFTVLHFLFVPLVAYPIRDIMEDRSKGETRKDLKKWIDIHRVRVLIADLPGWMSFLTAVLSSVAL